MKKDKTIYWVTTVLCMLMGAATAPMYFTQTGIEGFKHVGFPDYFRLELATGKIIGLLIILIPAIPARVKEWAYVAFGITFLSATIAHMTVDGPGMAIAPLIALCLLSVSYTYYHKITRAKELIAQKA